MNAPSTDRVRRHTAQEVLDRIDQATENRLREVEIGGPVAAGMRLHELDREWDWDRVVELEGSLVGLTGMVLGTWVDRRFYLLSAMAASMMALQSATGWYPLGPVFRRMGIRSGREIERERMAVKAIRGDFDSLVPQEEVLR